MFYSNGRSVNGSVTQQKTDSPTLTTESSTSTIHDILFSFHNTYLKTSTHRATDISRLFFTTRVVHLCG